ncbi:hypothetical protein [Streptomyces roseoviridis]|uniref:Uncharacterized protein n=1 Tax=Streptomyces roseoviridis TaxID=67361 RepID=A0ABV5R078_9ACTN
MTTDDDTPKTIEAYIATTVRSTIEADQLFLANPSDPLLRASYSQSAINGFLAATALMVLRQHAPETAAALAEYLDGAFTAGDLGPRAYTAAKTLGHDPDQWIAELEQRTARRKAAAR